MARKMKSKRRSKRAGPVLEFKDVHADYQIGSIIKRLGQSDEKALIIYDDQLPLVPGTMFAFIRRSGRPVIERLDPFELWLFDYKIIETMTHDEVKTLRGAYKARNLPTISKAESGEIASESVPRRLYEGFPMTPVIRWMGSQEWSEEDAAQVFEKLDLKVALSTIKINIKAGLLGKRGKPADLDKDQATYLESLRGGSELKTSCFTGGKKQKRGRSRRTK